MIPDAVIEQVRERVSILDVVSEVVELKREGTRRVGLCPFHNEKTPSFAIDETREPRRFHCFGCGEHGDVFDFVMKTRGVGFPEAVRELVPRAGVSLPDDSAGDADPSPVELEVFARERKLPEVTLRAFGIKAVDHHGRPALRYPTLLGIDRIKYLDGKKPKYRWVEKGGKAHWYALEKAIALLTSGRTLYVVNGEPSVWACHARGEAAVSLCAGEGTAPKKPALVQELREALAAIGEVPVRIVFDVDQAGRRGAHPFVAALRAGGIADAVALDLEPVLPGVKKADVDDLHRRVGEKLAEVLGGLPELSPAGQEAVGPDAARRPRPRPQRPATSLALTDLGNARRLVELHGRDLRFCPQAAHGWHVWDGVRWIPDVTMEIMRRAKDVVRDLLRAATDAEDTRHRADLARWALTSQSAERLAAMVKLAASEPGIPVVANAFDADPWLLTVSNGSLDLRTGELRPHCRGDLITKLAPVVYDPEARLPLWETFLRETTAGNPELAAFLQRAVGYSLTGDTSEEKLFFVHGPEASGKSTFVEAVKAMLGDYAQTADFETFLARRNAAGPRNDVACLAGARFVASIEVDEGKRLAQGLVKQLTGGDTVAARFLYRELFEFRPAFKLWLAANHAPKVSDRDGAVWRRILRVPFEHTVPKERRDRRIKATLIDPRQAGPAILTWALAGLREWRTHGLGVPPVVSAATAAYRAEQDPLRDFFAERCVFDTGAWVSLEGLWQAYQAWAKEGGERLLTRHEFNDRLRARGALRGQHRDGESRPKTWDGVRLRGENEPEASPDESETSTENPVTEGSIPGNLLRDSHKGTFLEKHPQNRVTGDTPGTVPSAGDRDEVEV